MAQELEKQMKEDLEIPKIIIIASAKVSSWEDKIEISNVSATNFYLNFNHHSVFQLRQMLSTPLFSKYDFSSQFAEKLQKLNAEEIKKLGVEYIEAKVICDVKFQQVHELNSWNRSVCTTCFNDVRIDGEYKTCVKCNRNVPHPDRKFNVVVDSFDNTGTLELLLEDRPVRTLIRKTVFDLEDEGIKMNNFPHILKQIENKAYTLKIRIMNTNIKNNCQLYKVIDIYEIDSAFGSSTVDPNGEEQQMQESMTETSTSTFHLDGLSQMSFKSPPPRKKKSSARVSKKKTKS
ncbi:hypothetical protein POM88_032963 [Heracleum sosnowskyi]|uniref:Replication factor A C-terminal domain-containing protein n=1 Tax=Heracleum sosnowskyi TaxID=360622 RepID=A0AAD8MI09_9APIA|nr:hypothetical protein POM88_032963 [Heracleum sosnowskyi]